MFDLSDIHLNFFLVLSSIFCYVLYVYVNKYKYWENLGIPHTGFLKDFGVLFKTRSYVIQSRYKELAPHPFGGIYSISKPFLIVRDPQLIQNILIKDFSHFVDRGTMINEDVDPLNGNLFHLRGQRWKNIRAKLTPTFSSAKLKSMFPLMEECVKVLDRHLKRVLDDSPELEVRGLMLKFASDVIGICAFGLNCNMIDNKNSELTKVTQQLLTTPLKFVSRQILRAICPQAISLFKWKGMSQEVEDYFLTLARESKRFRAENVDKRNDFMQLLINVQHDELAYVQNGGENKEVLFTDNTVAAHVFVFFFAGHETTATTLGYCLYELSLNPEIMERLHEEIKTTLAANGGNLNYETLKGMDYLECVISETMRKYPVAGALDRQCTKPYQVPGSNFVIEEKTNLIIPVFGLHYDPQYYPDPEKFDPDRFNEENKHKIVPGTYLPFGDGPRICIGMRFALMEMKAALTLIIGNYTVHPTEKTQIPIKFKPFSLNAPEKGVHLRFQKRERQLINFAQSTQVDSQK